MKNLKRIFLAVFLFFSIVRIVRADAVIDNGINFLKFKQDEAGKITNGFSGPSQWGAIALVANGLNPAEIKTVSDSASLRDFLLTDIPSDNSPATDWENRILAIVAMNDDPTNFGGFNYLQKLESFYGQDKQIGEICALNDDIFGLLALIASGNSANNQIKQDVLDFIISKQDTADGGFGWSAPGCPWYGTAPDMTAAAVQALQAAKDNSLINPNLDGTMTKAKDYLLAHQNSDGGFAYFGPSDADTTSWVLQAFNVLGLKDSIETQNAKNWLISHQQTDGGFLGWGGTDTTTTSQVLIALAGKGWLLKILNPSVIPSPTSSVSPISTPTPTPTSSFTPTPTPTLTPTPTSSPTPSPTPLSSPESTPTSSPTLLPSSPSPSPEILAVITSPSPEVLGQASSLEPPVIKKEINPRKIFLIVPGLIFILLALKLWLANMA